MVGDSRAARLLRFDAFELDTHAGELRKKGVRLRLQGQPLLVLEALLRRAGDLVTREELRTQIWQGDTFVDFDHSLHNAIARLRQVLGDSADSPRYIETLPRRGYRFIPAVESISKDAAAGQQHHASPTVSNKVRALAVLPLDDLSGEAAEDYFADSMTEALITSLAKIKALRVISRTSAMQYKGAHKSLPQIARELSVDAVVEGSVLRSQGRVRVTVQLIRASSDQHLWAESYERDFQDILALQSEIAREVAERVKVVLTPQEAAHLRNVRQVNPAAHELYLRARYFWNKRTEDGVRKALMYFQRSLDEDPSYAQGYAGLADSYHILGYYSTMPPMEAYPKARAAAMRALQLDASLAEPHAALGVVKRDFEWDWSGAEEEFQHAIRLNPGYVEAHHWRATLLKMIGRDADSAREKQKALALDPLSVVVRTDVARMLYFSRDYGQAIARYLEALEMDSGFASAYLWLAQAYAQKGMMPEAISAAERGNELSGGTMALARLGQMYALADKTKEARATLAKLKSLPAERYVSPYDLALFHIALQEREPAFAALENALAQRSLWLGYVNLEPQLDPLHSDPRFQLLLRQVGLPGRAN